ncbi:MAG TPA: CDP-alcohol phosphatidyltransferase family protein [Chlamydiales bacterium]|nr:CDP-alcohol phosphatidyltransferase family protein [Chlamydiales bacterium]
MKYLPTILSFLRFPLALLLFIQDPIIRLLAIIAALVTDVLDGFLARRWKATSKLGTLIDPASDKCFVMLALWVFFHEGRLQPGQLIAFLGRDISLLLFSCWLWLKGDWKSYTIASFFCGKVVTAMQFITLIGLCLDWPIPSIFFIVMALFGAASFAELVVRHRGRNFFNHRDHRAH